MVRAISPRETFDYVLDVDRDQPAEKRTGWELWVLSQSERNALYSAMKKSDIDFAYFAMRMCVAGFSNFIDTEGNEVTFETAPRGDMRGTQRTEFISDSCLRTIPMKYWVELGKAAMDGNVLAEDDLKN